MASTLSKRQQARNERALQDLIKNVPGNNTCADCGARNPGWASWSLGIFLCMRCAALHRKLGTHISKVKSLSMDKWDSAQVDNMKRIGNTDSNKTYNPRNVQPQIPIDVDEVDGAMERYIRQKYEQRVYLQDSRPGTRQNTGSTSSEDRPPPLPPKPTGRFGFGLRKAITSPKNLTPPVSPGLGSFGQDTSPPRVNKASRVFGSSVSTSGDGLESKLTTLREMGFADDKRNATVLKGLNGNLDRTVEALIRLGEQAPGKSTAPPPPAKPSTNGLTLGRAKTEPAPPASSNPFDALDAAPLPVLQQQQPSMGTNGASMQAAPAQNSYNPFLSQMSQSQYQQPGSQSQQQPQQQQQPSFYDQNPFGQQQQQPSLEQSFQNMQLSYQQQQQQPLFPNRTGGYGQPSRPAQTNPFLQSFTPPPMPQIPEQYSSFFAPQPQYQSMSNPSSPGGNPFLKTSRSQIFTPSNATPFGQVDTQQQFQQQQASNPWAQQQQPQQQPQQPTQTTSPSLASNPWQQQAFQHTGIQQSTTTPQPSFQQQSYPQTSMQQPSTTASQPSFQQQTFQQTGLQQPSTTTPQPNFQQQSFSGHPNPFDKSSILNLYNQPQQQQTQQTPIASLGSTTTPTPMAGNTNMNPFASSISPQPVQQSSMAVAQQQAQGTRHVSNESVDFAGLMGGRHSPDAFSGLSASFRR